MISPGVIGVIASTGEGGGGGTPGGGSGVGTVALLHFDGSDASTVFVDSAPNIGSPSRVWTAVGNAQLDTAQKQWGTASLLCDGTGDYIQTIDHADFDMGSEHMSLECWVRFAALPGVGGYDPLIAKWAAAPDNSYNFYTINVGGTRKIGFSWSTDGTNNAGDVFVDWTPLINTWYFMQCIRSGTTMQFAVDGAQVGTDQMVSGTFFNSAATLKIGGDGFESVNGWIDDARVSKGIARAIALPTEAFPDS